MKEKTSITLSSDLLASIDRLSGGKSSRSSLIESILREHFRSREKQARHVRDLARINRAAQRLNAEAEDVLGYQASEDS